MAVVEVEHLTKRYGDLTAVDDVSFSLEPGEVFALLGPNGAGKTTTVEILEGARPRTSGSVRVLGHDPARRPRELRERTGVVLQEAGFEEEFTVAELVELHGRMYPRRVATAAVVEQVGLTDKAHARVRTLSGGQRRRLDLALGLVGAPELLFLDEPTTGFDPGARRRAWDLVEGLRRDGTTVLLTTHYLDEAEHLADRVAVVVRGRLVALGTPAELGARRQDAVVTFRLPETVDLSALPALDGVLVPDGLDWHLTTARPTAALHTLTGWAAGRELEIPALTVRRPSLEDVYLGLVAGAGETGPDDPADDGRPTRRRGPRASGAGSATPGRGGRLASRRS
ncbi:ABC transporter [Actinotalea ferrariae CF5-4]|uniref:ABC transporter n=1 Tax=Actinotalea ferrariae CF5-4 TaxID=948458 RepID=A0A021VXH6_9CELL|nr:ABC transporter ATP-binding protein [Actinotalea ferrariae]EYR63797.1 ABC transporter [Actinotalea ferrariae CF5-4]